MSFFAVLFALLIEQVKPLPRVNRVGQLMRAWVTWVARTLDAGQLRHARMVWGVSVVVPAVLATAVYLLVRQYSLLLAMAFDVALLYLTLGFRQFSHYFTDIRDALDRGDEAEARRHLAQWKDMEVADLPRTELLRQVLEHALLAAHRYVFGVFFWFVLLSAHYRQTLNFTFAAVDAARASLARLDEFQARLAEQAGAVAADARGVLAPRVSGVRAGTFFGGGGDGIPRMFSSTQAPRITGCVSTPLAVAIRIPAWPRSPP
jgi:cobalamin biosynthesis protein CobD/CbiB